MSKPTPHIPTEADKEKMQHGAAAMRAIDKYLTYLDSEKPRGRRPDPAAIEAKIADESNLARKTILIADLHRANDALAALAAEDELAADFVKYAPWFSDQHKITYPVWREMGVPVAVLKEAGIQP